MANSYLSRSYHTQITKVQPELLTEAVMANLADYVKTFDTEAVFWQHFVPHLISKGRYAEATAFLEGPAQERVTDIIRWSLKDHPQFLLHLRRENFPLGSYRPEVASLLTDSRLALHERFQLLEALGDETAAVTFKIVIASANLDLIHMCLDAGHFDLRLPAYLALVFGARIGERITKDEYLCLTDLVKARLILKRRKIDQDTEFYLGTAKPANAMDERLMRFARGEPFDKLDAQAFVNEVAALGEKWPQDWFEAAIGLACLAPKDLRYWHDSYRPELQVFQTKYRMMLRRR